MIAFNVLAKKVKNSAEGECINFARTLKASKIIQSIYSYIK